MKCAACGKDLEFLRSELKWRSTSEDIYQCRGCKKVLKFPGGGRDEFFSGIPEPKGQAAVMRKLSRPQP